MGLYHPPFCIHRAANTQTISGIPKTYYGLLGRVRPESVVRVGRVILVTTPSDSSFFGNEADRRKAASCARRFRWVLSTRLFHRYEYVAVLTDGLGRHLAVCSDTEQFA